MIHHTAIVSPKAKIGNGTTVGPYSIIGDDVVIGDNCNIQEHVVIRGNTTIGNQVSIFPFAVIGGEPQHLKYNGEKTQVIIGDRTVLREYTTVHRGTTVGISKTIVGPDCLIMAYTHIAHDCIVGKNVILASSIQLAGHVEIGDYVTIGGASAIAQFCRVGSYCYLGGGSIIRKDVAPFLLGKGSDFEVQGINSIGLSKHGASDEVISQLKKLYKIIFIQKNTLAKALEKAKTELESVAETKYFLDFIESSKGFVR